MLGSLSKMVIRITILCNPKLLTQSDAKLAIGSQEMPLHPTENGVVNIGTKRIEKA